MIWPFNRNPVSSATLTGDYTGHSLRALIGGLTSVSPAYYNGWRGACPGCDVDVDRMARWARALKMQSIVLRESMCDFKPIGIAADMMVNQSPIMDLGLIYFSGHGSETRDLNGDEITGKDQTLCLYSGQMIDDRIGKFFKRFPAQSKILFMTDCCTSGSVAREVPPMVKAVQRASADFDCQLIHVAGCHDGEVSYGSMSGGELTKAWLKAARPGMTIHEIFDAMEPLDNGQAPVLTEYSVSPLFLNMKLEF